MVPLLAAFGAQPALGLGLPVSALRTQVGSQPLLGLAAIAAPLTGAVIGGVPVWHRILPSGSETEVAAGRP